jgi:hypothetical protein
MSLVSAKGWFRSVGPRKQRNSASRWLDTTSAICKTENGYEMGCFRGESRHEFLDVAVPCWVVQWRQVAVRIRETKVSAKQRCQEPLSPHQAVKDPNSMRGKKVRKDRRQSDIRNHRLLGHVSLIQTAICFTLGAFSASAERYHGRGFKSHHGQ